YWVTTENILTWEPGIPLHCGVREQHQLAATPKPFLWAACRDGETINTPARFHWINWAIPSLHFRLTRLEDNDIILCTALSLTWLILNSVFLYLLRSCRDLFQSCRCII